MAKSKIFRDPVHGYIAIDEDIVNDFIDTPQFQRLKRIKQTHLDVLFPTANQTRFEHSLGVYFLGKKLFKSIENNCPPEHLDELRSYQSTVELACLLHDIGHAPLSHIGEKFYKHHHLPAIAEKLEEVGIKIEKYDKYSPHELMSVLIAIKKFDKQLEDKGYNKDLFFRLITGSKFNSEALSPVKKALISILSSSFDVDKMDYIMRDAAAAGIPSVELDLDRIINSAWLVNHPDGKRSNEIVIAFGKSGFSVVTSIVNNRNYMYKWIYGHHKVQYQYQILNQFIKKLCELPEFPKFFSYETITGTSVRFGNLEFNYTDDYDIWCILKNAILDESIFKVLRDQLFNRKHYKAFWKTKIEFDEDEIIFAEKTEFIKEQVDTPQEFFQTKIKPKIPTRFGITDDDIIIFKSDPKIVYPYLGSNMYFCWKDTYTNKIVVKDYEHLFGKRENKEEEERLMFHIFVNKDKYSTELQKQIVDILSNL